MIKYLINTQFERLHRYIFDFCFQSDNKDWGIKTPYIKANRNNKYRQMNWLAVKFYSILFPFFKGWRKQLKSYPIKSYDRYESI